MRALDKRWLVFLTVAGAGVAMGFRTSGGGDAKPLYEAGWYRVDRGDAIALPAGTNDPLAAQYGGGGEHILVCAVGEDGVGIGPSPQPRNGWWVWNRPKGSYRMLHDNVRGELKWGGSLCQLGSARISPDGWRVVAKRIRYSEEAKAIDIFEEGGLERMEASLAAYEWVVINPYDKSETVLRDLTDQRRGVSSSWTPTAFIWVDDQRLAFTRHTLTEDKGAERAERGVIYTLEISTGEVTLVIREELGSDVGHLRRVSDGKMLYWVMSAEGIREGDEYLDNTPVEEWDRDRELELMDVGTSLKLADLTGKEPVVTTLLTVADGVDLCYGLLSPDERYYAYYDLGDEREPASVWLLDLETEQRRSLRDTRVALWGWHPDGDKLLATVGPSCPADPRGLLIEIPVEDILAEFRHCDGTAHSGLVRGKRE